MKSALVFNDNDETFLLLPKNVLATECWTMFVAESAGLCGRLPKMVTFLEGKAQRKYHYQGVNQFCMEHIDNMSSRLQETNSQGIFVKRRKRYRIKKKKKRARKTTSIPDGHLKRPVMHTWQNTLFVCKLNSRTNDITLQDLFEQFGKIKKLKLVRNSKTGKSRSYAFIEYEDHISFDKAYSDSVKTDIIIDDVKISVHRARDPAIQHKSR